MTSTPNCHPEPVEGTQYPTPTLTWYEARFHNACFYQIDTASLELDQPYRPPLNLPYHWSNDISGQLPVAVKKFIDHRIDPTNPSPSLMEFLLLKSYFHYYINAPNWLSPFPSALAQLRADIQRAQTTDDLARWISACLDIGVDPL